jgi:hypothetical protein
LEWRDGRTIAVLNTNAIDTATAYAMVKVLAHGEDTAVLKDRIIELEHEACDPFDVEEMAELEDENADLRREAQQKQDEIDRLRGIILGYNSDHDFNKNI